MKRRIVVAAAALATLALLSVAALGQDRHDNHERDHAGSHALYPQLDQRYHHNHYYPPRGYAAPVLPSGSISVAFGGGHYFYHAGVWFRPAGGRYVVIVPPLGVVVPLLPPAYATLWIGGAPYYYANGVYYAPAPGLVLHRRRAAAGRRLGRAASPATGAQGVARADHLSAQRPERRADRDRPQGVRPLGGGTTEHCRSRGVPARAGGVHGRTRLLAALTPIASRRVA